jgi:hypothetical protein
MPKHQRVLQALMILSITSKTFDIRGYNRRGVDQRNWVEPPDEWNNFIGSK